MVNCSFNDKWIQTNGIYTNNHLNINGGNGIVDILTNTNATLTGIQVIVLNNATYYYPSNSNINLTDNPNHKI